MRRSVGAIQSLFVAGLLAGAEFASGAEAAKPKELALDALVAEVLEKNPELKFYRAEIAAVKGERRAAATLANPEVSSQLGAKTVRGGGSSDEGLAWSVSVQQSFEWPGRVPLRKAIANQQIRLAELGYGQFQKALEARARTAAYTLFAARQKAAVAQDVANRLQALREVLVQRDPAGLTPVLETRIIEATEITLHRKASEEALEMQAALLQLNQLRGEAFDSSIQIAASNVTLVAAPSMKAVLAAARTNNFELQIRRAELEQQGFKIALVENERYPSVAVGPYFSQERAGETENIVGIGVTVPLPLWNRNQGNIEVARAREAQAQTTLYVTQREIEQRVAEQAIRYEAKLAEIAKWRPDSIEQLREAATLADRHYRLGAVPISTYVELQKQYLEAVEALLDTRRDALEAGQKLQALTGINFDAPQKTP